MTDSFGRGVKPASVTEEERRSKREVGGTQKYSWNIPIGMYRELQHIAEEEHMAFPQVLARMCRGGIQAWRRRKSPGPAMQIVVSLVQQEVSMLDESKEQRQVLQEWLDTVTGFMPENGERNAGESADTGPASGL